MALIPYKQLLTERCAQSDYLSVNNSTDHFKTVGGNEFPLWMLPIIHPQRRILNLELMTVGDISLLRSTLLHMAGEGVCVRVRASGLTDPQRKTNGCCGGGGGGGA